MPGQGPTIPVSAAVINDAIRIREQPVGKFKWQSINLAKHNILFLSVPNEHITKFVQAKAIGSLIGDICPF